jgi:hypothetical protein
MHGKKLWITCAGSRHSRVGKDALLREITHRRNHSAALCYMCPIAAAVQGMNESVINGGELSRCEMYRVMKYEANVRARKFALL